MKNLNKQLGISLVEIMVSLVISLFLLGGIIQVYTANKSSYAFTEAIGFVQENARFAVDTISQDLRMAGYFGCTAFDPDNLDNITNNLNPAGADFNPILHQYAQQGVLDATNGDGINGSDSLTIRGAKPRQFNVRSHPLPSSNPITMQTNLDQNVVAFEDGDILIVSNCEGADIFEISGDAAADATGLVTINFDTDASSPGNVNTDPDCNLVPANALCLSQNYGTEASMVELQTVTYAIQNVVRADGQTEPTLMRIEYGQAEALVEGIEQMQILYGLDTTNDGFPNQYTTLNNPTVAQINDVIAVRLQMLVRSDTGANVGGPQTVSFNGADLTFNDNRLRQVFTTTVALRNRIGSTP